MTTVPFDADDTDSHAAFVEEVSNRIGDLDVVIVAFGILGDQAADEAGGDGAVRLGQTNYIGAMSIGLAVSRRLKEQGHGTLVVLSSVAGERARRSNFIYGSSKAASTPSPRVSATPWPAPGQACSSCGPASCRPR